MNENNFTMSDLRRRTNAMSKGTQAIRAEIVRIYRADKDLTTKEMAYKLEQLGHPHTSVYAIGRHFRDMKLKTRATWVRELTGKYIDQCELEKVPTSSRQLADFLEERGFHRTKNNCTKLLLLAARDRVRIREAA